MLTDKKRYSIPAKILELLYTNDQFFNEVTKLNKASNIPNFPRTDEWRDDSGFNISFALAGYAPEDISVEVEGNILTVKGNGLDSIANQSTPVEESDASKEYSEYSSKEGRPRIHIGSISRGIARRKFSVKLLISEEFDADFANANMQHGLLHIVIPYRSNPHYKLIKIN